MVLDGMIPCQGNFSYGGNKKLELQEISLPRTYAPNNLGEIVKAELRNSSDVSTHGYRQCSYLTLRNEYGNVHCALVMGKSMVSPLKVITIPRLEFTAAVIYVEMSNVLKRELMMMLRNHSGTIQKWYWGT